VGRLVWLLCMVCITLASLAIIFAVKRGRPLGELLADVLPAVTLALAFSLVGAVVAHRRPRHRLGWIFCTVGLSQGLVTFTSEYAVYALWTTPVVPSIKEVRLGAFRSWNGGRRGGREQR
jgi:hypothetical protein